MTNRNEIPEGWKWTLKEISNGTYRATLTSRQGLRVEKTGFDIDELLNWCITAADDIEQQLSLKFGNQSK